MPDDVPSHKSLHEKLDRVLLCLEGEPLNGKPGLVHRVGTVEKRLNRRSRLEGRIFKATGFGFLGAAGAWAWTAFLGKHS